MAGLWSHTTRATGLVLTAAIYNADHQNHIDNGIPAQHDDYSTNAAQMQSTTDPYPAGAESLATSTAGELERIRYVLKQITNRAQWYIDPELSLPSPGHLFGMTLSNNSGDATNDIDITAGQCSSSDAAVADRVLLSIAALTKRLDATWVTGT